MPLISFVMPNRNKALYLPDALRTLLNQTLEDIEIVVVDDDSTDDSRDIIDTFANKDNRIIRTYLGAVDGLPVAERIDRARNVGNRKARSDIICVCDSDDWYMPDRARITYEKLKEKKHALFYSAYLLRDRFGKKMEGVVPYQQAVRFSKRRLWKTGFFFIGHFTVGYKRETILKYPYNSDAGVGDWGMLYNLLVRAKVKPYYTQKPLCVYRIYANALKFIKQSKEGDTKFQDYLLDKKRKKMDLLNEA